MKQRAFLLLLGMFVLVAPVYGQVKNLLSPEEKLWLSERNNTIVVYPEQNSPPFAYQSVTGIPQGLSIDYVELAAEKVGAKIQYLTPRSRVQILDDIKKGKGDVAMLSPDADKETFLFFTEPYITVPAVIVVRKDTEKRAGLTLNDFNGKRVGVIAGSALESYVHTNYPRVVIEEVTDDEVSLQQTVLGEVDAAVMDVATLSYYLSKQVLSSVKIVGNTGFEYAPAFAVPKDKEILQSILSKGLSQVSTSDRAALTDKWIAVPDQQQKGNTWWTTLKNTIGMGTLYGLCGIGIAALIYTVIRHRHVPFRYLRRRRAIDSLKDEMSELEYASKELVNELENIKGMEQEIKDKIKAIE